MKRGSIPLTLPLLAVACLAGINYASADPPTAQPPPPGQRAAEEKSLDKQLLEGLDNDLLDDLDALPNPDDGDQAAPRTGDDGSPLDADLIDQLLEGDDLGAADDSDPHLQIGRRMQVAQDRIRARKTAAITQRLQQKIIEDLDGLIDQVRKSKCCGGDGQRQAGPTGKASQQPSAANAQAKKPARDGSPETSTDRVGESESPETDAARYRGLVKQVWGHLPERVREQMPNTSDEEFLPKYEELIENYFRRLAEEGRDGR